MTFVEGILADLRSKRLWPVVVALLVALVAVPVLLSTKAKSAPVAQPTVPFAPVTSAGPIPVLSVQPPPTLSRLTGPAHDPFAQRVFPATGVTGSVASVASASTSTASSSPSTGATGSSTSTSPASTSPGSTTTTPSLAPAPPTTVTSPTPTAPTGLTDTQSYRVKLAITTASGGLDTIDPLERLSVIPSTSEPRLVELGVLEGGHRVLFVVQPGTVLSGPGTCTPGPIDCEILSLAQNQVEQVSLASASDVVPIALLAVTGITADEHPSVAAAKSARQTASTAGRDLLSSSTLSALSLFNYEPSLGAVVDLRDLTIGAN